MNIRDKIRSIIFFTGFSTTLIFSVPVFAFDYNSDNETISATLENIKQESIQFLNNHNEKYVLNNGSPSDNDIKISISGTDYYFTPSDNLSDSDMVNLKNLVNVGNSALVETTSDDAMFSFGDNKFYKYDTEKLSESTIKYSKGNSNNYNFKISVKDSNGNDTTKYYKINLIPEKISKSNNITITNGTSADTNKIILNLPNDDTQYLKFEYDESRYDDVYTTRKTSLNTSNKILIRDVVYNLTTASVYGGGEANAINIQELNTDLILNRAISEYGLAFGGGIFNNADRTIGSFTGDVIANSTKGATYANGGGIYNYSRSTINYITGDIIGNSANGESTYARGGGLYNKVDGKIISITGNIIGNSANGSTSANGGGLYNDQNAEITSITGDIIGNSVNSVTSGAGGAIYNAEGTIGVIAGDIIGNSINSDTSAAQGGAIYNTTSGTIIGIIGDFIANSANGATYINGGGITNSGTITYIIGDIVANSGNALGTYANGGGVYNSGTITSFAGNVVGNSANAATYAQGGGIVNTGTISFIDGNFISNSATGNGTFGVGGGLYNSSANAQIDSIKGNFMYNSATGHTYAMGGGMYNYNKGTINSIIGDFISNSAIGNGTSARGGGLTNGSKANINDIEGDFISNSATGNAYVLGGAISNFGTINNITGDITFNSATGNTFALGGGIYNGSAVDNFVIDNGYLTTTDLYKGSGYSSLSAYLAAQGNYSTIDELAASKGYINSTITTIKGDIIGNSAVSNTNISKGGGIYNSGEITTIKGNIKSNSITGKIDTLGGGIFNNGTINSITGDFIENAAASETTYAYGGGLYNSKTINNITGDFTGNTILAKTNAYGAGIFNSGTIGNIEGDFSLNSALSDTSYARGGAIYNTGTVSFLKGDFTSNSVQSNGSNIVYGGAIFNNKIINNIYGNFIGNSLIGYTYAQGGGLYNTTVNSLIENVVGDFISNSSTGETAYATGGGLANNSTGNINNIKGNFISNSATGNGTYALGGGVYNTGPIENIEGDFISNSATGYTYASGGGLYNSSTGTIDSVVGNFTSNSATGQTTYVQGGGLYNGGIITDLMGNFTENSATGNTYAQGGGLWNNKIINNITGDFTGNSVVGNTDYAYGGAIYNTGANAVIDNIIGNFTSNSASSNSVRSYAGAIYNTGAIGNIEGDFNLNFVNSEKSYAYGGAIYNNKIITNIEGDFISNSVKGKTYAEAGGIYNSTNGTIENIIGNFIGNTANGYQGAFGSGITNWGTITNVKGNFQDNIATGQTANSLGGGLYNSGVIENLEGDFTGNSVTSKLQALGGGLFVNGAENSHITNIKSNFINNSATSLDSYALGGGYADYGYNSQNFAGNFINNSVTAGTYAYGGGMYGGAGNITGNFTNNNINAGTTAYGGGLYGYIIKNLEGDFTGNIITAGAYAQGGGMYNYTTENLIGNFKENGVTANMLAQGGGIYNGYKLLSFKGDVVNNYANSVLEEAQGGGIYNYAENAYNRFIQSYKSLDRSKIAKNIDEANIYAFEKKENERQRVLNANNMTEEEYNNKLAAERQQAIDNIDYTGYDSIEAWVQNNTSYSTLDEYLLKGLKKYRDMEEALHFNNYFSSVQERMEYLGYSTLDEMITGLDYTDRIGVIEEFRGNIIGNSAISEKDIAQGGGLFNRGKAVIYDSDITFNTAKGADAQGGAIYNGGEFAKLYLVADKKDLTFINNKTIKNDETQSNAIHNEAKVYLNTNKTVEDTSKNNNNTDGRIVIHDKISGNYADNNNSLPSFEINKPISEFLYSITENNETTDHNLVLNQTTGAVEFHNDIKGNDINLYNGNTIIVADNNDITLGNNLETITFKTNNAKLNINAFNNNSILANLKISQDTGVEASVDINKPDILITKTELNTKTNDSGEEEYTGTVKNTRYEISEEETRGNVIFNNDVNVKNVNMYNGELTLAHNITSQNVNLYGGTINMSDGINFNSNQYFNVYGGDLNLQNNTIGNTNLGNLVLNNELGLKTDIDFTHHKSDTITVNSLTNNGDYNINLKDIKVLNPVLAKSFNTSLIGDIQDEELKSRLASSVKYTGGDIVYSPIYKYGVSYDKETGKLTFARSGGSDEINTNPTYEEVNPAVMSSTVTRNTVAYATQANAYYEGFRSLNEMMYNTRVERFALKNKNKYALLNTKDEKIDSLLKSGIQADDEEKTGWFKAGSSIETISLKHGPKTDNTLYYSFVGFDSELREISKFKVLKGWDFMTGAYVGYNGGYQKFDGVSSTSNGLNIGTTLNLFKGNFFTGTTLGSGLMFSEASNMYGNESFKTLSTGIANKTGYNFEFKDGKYIIQPSLFISYSLFNTMDYTNASGVKIKSDALHLFTFEPGIKFIANLDNGWQPYVTLSFADNIDLGGKVKAQDVVLPDVSVKPYVKYGVGVRKKWKDNISGFAQIYLTNGGRTGVGLQVGFNWLFDTRNMFVKNKDRNGDL